MFSNIRFYVLVISLSISLLIYIWVKQTIPGEILQTIRLTQIFALLSITYLYFALLIGPINYMFRWLPYRAHYVKARRAIGVSAFYFAVIHAYTAFFGQLGGFGGLQFLSSKYLLAITLSTTALLILTAMALTSFDGVIEKMKFTRWKLLHRLIYLASILIVIHALMLGTHFSDLSNIIPQIMFIAIGFLLILEALRFDFFLNKKFKTLPKKGITLILTGIFLLYVFLTYINPLQSGTQSGFGIHSEHIRKAQNNNLPTYNVTLNKTKNVQPNTDIELTFNFTDSKTGNEVFDFEPIYEKLMHLVIVDSSLTYYDHIHPVKTGSQFKITTNFPTNGRYYLYADFLPSNSVEQNKRFIVDVGDSTEIKQLSIEPNKNLTNTFSNYNISLKIPSLSAEKMNIGSQDFIFEIRDSNNSPVKNLKTYLGAYGHMVMINSKNYNYIHVHPYTIPEFPGADGGPEVKFTPLPIFGKIEPGVYKVFTQFNPNNNLILTEFIVKVD